MDSREEIRARLSIEEVVGQYVQMKKSGRNFKANCPFHNEKTPSFIISPDKGLAYCFGCRKGGDIFAFVQEIENVSFPEAMQILGEKAGVEVKRMAPTGPSKEKKERGLALIQEAQNFFVQQLKQQDEARSYLENRGYDVVAQKELGFGYAADSFHHLTEFLQKKGYSPQEMLDAGLAAQKNVGDSNVYDRFRHRVMFPIHDSQGRLVAFGGRTLSKKPDAAKYLNSPETNYYHKGNTLYGFHLAKKPIRDQDRAIVVEGYFDALSCQRHGFPNTVASLGTALTENQIRLIMRFTQNLSFAFDADESGQTAASRSIEIAQRLGCNVSVIRIPSDKDPDEAVRNHPDEWKGAVEGAAHAVDYEFEKCFAQHDVSQLVGKKKASQRLLPIIQRLPSSIDQEHFLKKLAFALQTSIQSLMAELKKLKPQFQAAQPAPEAEQVPGTNFSRGQLLIGLLMANPKFLKEGEKLAKWEFWESEQQKELYNALCEAYNQSELKELDLAQISDQETTDLQLLELYTEEHYADFSDTDLGLEVEKLAEGLRSSYKKRRLRYLSMQLATEQDAKQQEALMKEHKALLSDQF